jgi:hypothetical protein
MRGVGRLVLLGALGLAACTSDSKPAATGSSTSSSASPPRATLTLQLPDGVVPIGAPQVNCFFPTVDGLQIAVLAFSPDDTQTYRIAVAADGVVVRHGTGSGTDFKERVYRGGGVSGFDATKGATIDASLIEDGDPGAKGSLRGSLDCGDQMPGSSTITLTGDTAAGHLDHTRLEPALVECYRAAGEVIVLGIANTGASKVHLLVSLTPQGLGVEEEVPPSGQQRYSQLTDVASGADFTGNSAHANGDVADATTSPPRALHIEGDTVCGTPISG